MYRGFIYIVLIIVSASCKLLQPNDMFKTPKNFQYSEFKDLDKEYTIKPFDKLNIIISTNQGANMINISGTQQNQAQAGLEYLVEHDGQVKLPSLGRIVIAGKTIREAEKFLESEYSKYYQQPFVFVKVTNRRVFIFSEGGSSATVLTLSQENFTLVEAIAGVGGLSLNSKSYRIKLIRGDVNNNPEIFFYNIYKLKDLQKSNLILQANDIIYVESRPRYVVKILAEITPYLTLASTMLLIYGLFTR